MFRHSVGKQLGFFSLANNSEAHQTLFIVYSIISISSCSLPIIKDHKLMPIVYMYACTGCSTKNWATIGCLERGQQISDTVHMYCIDNFETRHGLQ